MLLVFGEKRWKESSSRKVEGNSCDWGKGLEFFLEERHLLQSRPLEFDCFSFALFPQGYKGDRGELNAAKGDKTNYFRPLLSYSREWKAQELWLARITKGEEGGEKMESAD